jgi:hypothetical protein
MGSLTTRRELLRRGGAVVAGFAVGSQAGTAFGRGAGTATSPAALGSSHRRAFTDLADTVLRGPSLRLPANAVEAAVADFEAAYVSWPAADRRRADAVLDALGSTLASRGRGAREAALRPGGGEASERLARDAMALVSVATRPADDELAHAEVTL